MKHEIDFTRCIYHLVKALQATKNLSNGDRKLLHDLNIHLIDTKLTSSHHTIMSLHSNHLKIWDSEPAVISKYLQAVSDVLSLTATLQNTNTSGAIAVLSARAQSTLQMAMARLQDELIHTLMKSKYCFLESRESMEYEDQSHVEFISSETEQYVKIELIHPGMIPRIKSIADIMFASGYNQEFCLTFTAFWRDTLDEYMTLLDMEPYGVEDVLHMEWKFLNSRVRKWCVAIKSIIHFYLASAKRTFNQILGDYRQIISSTCFAEASKAPLLCLLNFGQAVSIGPRKPEYLFCLLDMYEAVEALLPDINALFPEEFTSFINTEFHDLLIILGDSAKAIWKELGRHITSRSSSTPFANGGIHPLTKYVMNYILFFTEYGDTLHLLVESRDSELSDKGKDGLNLSCAVATHLQSLTTTLEANLDHKSNLYKDLP